MTPLEVLAQSKALWNRDRLDLRSDEVLAQVLDRGSLEDWRALYALAKEDAALRARIIDLVRRVPMYLPHFWLSAMTALGETVDHDAVAKDDGIEV
jgi:hypothetical protein